MKTKSCLALKAIPVKQPIGDFYCASIKARDLVNISYSDVRRLSQDQRDFERYLGIQRPVSKSRVRDIKNYIRGRDATFPTAVIIAVDQRCAEFDEERGILSLSAYNPDAESDDAAISVEKIARVIDGQHRIAAFMDEDKNWSFDNFDRADDFEINLAIFVGADISEQANIFATVNLAQTKVSRSLVYDLTELAKTRSPHRTCHNVAVMLDRESRSPLYHRIKRLGTATPGRKFEPLTQAVFVESLVGFLSQDPVADRNCLLDGGRLKKPDGHELRKAPFRALFVEDKELDIAEILFNYFSAIRQKWPNSWEAIDKPGNLLPKSNAFKALMKYLKDDVYINVAGGQTGKVPKISDFSEFFKHIKLQDRDFTTQNFVPGSGGQALFLKMLRGEISIGELFEK